MARSIFLKSAILLSCLPTPIEGTTDDPPDTTSTTTESAHAGTAVPSEATSSGTHASSSSTADPSTDGMSSTAGAPSSAGSTTTGTVATSDSETASADLRRVFLSSATFPANFGSVEAADTKCQIAAEAAGLSGTFLAWISAPMIGVADRFTHSDVPYVRIDDVQVAANWSDLTDGDINAAIEIDEWGTLQNNSDCGNVWTGTLRDGAPHDEDACTAWTLFEDSVILGRSDVSNYMWSEGCLQDCTKQYHLYCFEQ